MGEAKQLYSAFKLKPVPVMGQTGTAASHKRPGETKLRLIAKKQALLKSHTQLNHFKLPKGLVGAKSTAQIKIEGEDVSCLLDTGSQVTTVPHSFYQSHLSKHHSKNL